MSALSYDPETGFVMKNGRRVGWEHSTGYRHMSFQGKQHKEHRVIWLLMTGKWPEFEIDHKNRKRNDNRWENLRDVPASVNQRNTGIRADNSTGQKGVTFHRRIQRYVARVRTSAGERKHIGTFKSAEAATLALKLHSLY